MKKLLSFVFAIIMIFSISMFSVKAKNKDVCVTEKIEYFEDGSYMITTIEVEKNNIARATSTVTGSKTVEMYSVSDVKMVTLKLTATFSYTGSSATCTNVSPTFTVHDSNYRVTKSTGTKSGNKGVGDFTVKHYVLGVPINTKNVTITITCSNTGTLS